MLGNTQLKIFGRCMQNIIRYYLQLHLRNIKNPTKPKLPNLEMQGYSFVQNVFVVIIFRSLLMFYYLFITYTYEATR